MNAALVVVPPAALDIATEDLFSEQLRLAGASQARVVVVDFARVTFCDTSALRVLVLAKLALDADGCVLQIREPSTGLRRIATLLSLDDALGLERWLNTSLPPGRPQSGAHDGEASLHQQGEAPPGRAPETVRATAPHVVRDAALGQRMRDEAERARLIRLLSKELRARGSAARDRAAGHQLAREGTVDTPEPPIPTHVPPDL